MRKIRFKTVKLFPKYKVWTRYQVELFTDSRDIYLWSNILGLSIYFMTASTQPSYPLIHLLAIYRMLLMQICKIKCRSLSERYSWYQRLIKYCSKKYSFKLKTACMKNKSSYRNMASTDHCKFLKWEGVAQCFCIFWVKLTSFWFLCRKLRYWASGEKILNNVHKIWSKPIWMTLCFANCSASVACKYTSSRNSRCYISKMIFNLRFCKIVYYNLHLYMRSVGW